LPFYVFIGDEQEEKSRVETRMKDRLVRDDVNGGYIPII